MLHRRLYDLKTRERLYGPAALIFGENSHEFLLLDDHLLFVDDYAQRRIVTAFLAELFLRAPSFARHDQRTQHDAQYRRAERSDWNPILPRWNQSVALK